MDCDISSQNTNYDLLKQDPELLCKVIDKYVKVDTIKNNSYMGFVHSIDPVTHSMILSIPQEASYKTILIPGHAILVVNEQIVSGNEQPPQRMQATIVSKEDLLKKKNKLMKWFESNLLPVTELDDTIIIGDVSLLPPYNILDVCTDNPIVALQIKNILERMPADFDS